MNLYFVIKRLNNNYLHDGHNAAAVEEEVSRAKYYMGFV